MRKIQRLAVLTSGGDAPGMNAAIRAVVRSARALDIETYGIQNGYAGLLESRLRSLEDRDVGGILQRGGTVLGSARCPSFCSPEMQQHGIHQLENAGIDGLVVIGGNGSQQGALALHRHGLPVVGIASTIDNDLAETETTIGVDTALNTSTSLIDRLKDTATSHHRAFIVEVMGRESGYLAIFSAIASGAELAVVPEYDITAEEVANDVELAYGRGKLHYIVVVAEGAKLKARELTEYLNSHRTGFEARLSVLGHVQRGGSPTVRDRVLASHLGYAAVQALVEQRLGVLAGWAGGRVLEVPLEAAVQPCQKVTPEQMRLAAVLAR